MRVLVFGIGARYARLSDELQRSLGEDTLLGFIDNKAASVRSFEGRNVYLPQEAVGLDFDLVVLTSVHWEEMRAQLLELGVSEAKIMLVERYIALKAGNRRTFYGEPRRQARRRVILIMTDLNYDGGSLVATYAARAMCAGGIDVLLCAPRFNERLKAELLAKGAYLCEYPRLPYASDADLLWIKDYDVAIVNVFQNISVAVKLHKMLPTLWWIHECTERTAHIYGDYRARYPEYDDLALLRPLNILAVSPIAARAFAEFYPGCVKGLLPFGIPDERSTSARTCGQITLAIIGGVQTGKGQMYFADAYERVKTPATRALIIGNVSASNYARTVAARASEVGIELTGLQTREQLAARFADIDIVVCPSLEETMSIAVIEGLMNGCICITSDNTGVADYIEDGQNGFICRTGDTDSLAEKMHYAIEHIEELATMRERARATYEQHFSMPSFARRLEALLDEYTGGNS